MDTETLEREAISLEFHRLRVAYKHHHALGNTDLAIKINRQMIEMFDEMMTD